MKFNIVIMILATAVVFASCTNNKNNNSSSQPQISSSSSSYAVSNENDPEGALAEFYKDNEIKGVEDGDVNFVIDTLAINQDDFYEFYIKKTEGKYGVSDIYIIEPADDKEDVILKALTNYKDKCIAAYKDYNIYNSLEIAQNTEIIKRGKYIILIMTDNNEKAIEILKAFIPAK